MKTISRKTISLLLAVMLALSLSVTAFATTIEEDTADQTGETAITYAVSPTYTVTIPASVEIGDSATISAEDVVVDEGKKVVVKITATSADNGEDFTITSNDGAGEDDLTYTVKNGSTSYSLGDAVLTVDPADGTSGSVDLTFALAAGETPSTPAPIPAP